MSDFKIIKEQRRVKKVIKTIKYATIDNPKGKYKKGTVFTIKGQKTKVANGTFKITTLFGEQPHTKGDAYFLYKRVLKNGKLSKNIKMGLRSSWGSRLDRIAKIK
jgi:hypothetical protein